MRRKSPTTLLLIFLSLFLFGFLSLYYSRDVISGNYITFLPANLMTRPHHINNPDSVNHAIREEEPEPEPEDLSRRSRRVASIEDYATAPSPVPVPAVQESNKSAALLLPAWEVLVLVSPGTPQTSPHGESYYTCLFPNKETSPARFAGIFPFSNQAAFKCDLPLRNRHLRPFVQPIITRYPEKEPPATSLAPELFRWNFLVYDSLSTESDVILLVKGLNNRQGINRSPNEFRCVFGEDSNSVKTAVTSSIQEVFRCIHPNLTALGSGANDERIKVSIEITEKNLVVPSVVYYKPPRKIANPQPKSLLCACTMVYNVAKFLREWIMYHSKIGVEKFILYDNESDDDLQKVVKELNQEGYDVSTLFWIWPKTQEAGFSHAAIYAKDSCSWMMYLDVDEFVFSTSWENSSHPSDQIPKSLLPRNPQESSPSRGLIGQVSIKCNDFGPSNQVAHPVEGVTQGYTCRRRIEQRHKSIVLLDAIDHSLFNAIHHFGLREGYTCKSVSMDVAVVNHYKYQAWSEFKTKFRRRVSAYVVDWTQSVNPKSNDRTPGLGFEAVEPKGWAQKFCEVEDKRLKLLTQKWFATQTPTGYKMAWQR